jgi:hypothetical protein
MPTTTMLSSGQSTWALHSADTEEVTGFNPSIARQQENCL